MKKLVAVWLAGAVVLSAVAPLAHAEEKKGEKNVALALNFKMESLDGKPVDLSRYQGKVILMVNVASQCGNTPQYKGLEALYEKYGKDGLVVLGFPANDFGSQEPGTNEEIAEFCSKNYKVKFPMFSKVSVKGNDQCPLYQFLTSKDMNPDFGGPVTWNFEKFLINRKGEIVARFTPRTKPESDAVVKKVEAELKKK